MILLIVSLNTALFAAHVDYTFYRDIDALNNVFEDVGMSHRFEDRNWGWSWSAFVIQKGFMMGIQNVRGDQYVEEGQLACDMSFDARMYEVGYLLDLDKAMLYFKGGGGYINTHLYLTSIADSSTFTGILRNPGGNAHITGSGLSLSANTGAIIPLSDYLGLSGEAGYIYALKRPDWKLSEGSEVYGGPDMDLSHLYLKVGIVIGEFINK